MKRSKWTTLAVVMSLAVMGSQAWGSTSPTSKLERAVQDTVDTLRSLESRLDTIDDQIAEERETVKTLDRSLDTGKDPKAIVTALNEASKRVTVQPPLTPSLAFCQSSGADLPRAQIAPKPVITTRRSATGCP